jgi:hypothetical protein
MTRSPVAGVGLAALLGLAGPFAGAAQVAGEVKSLSGAVAVESVGERQIMIAVDTVNEGRPLDGLVDHLFRFVAEEPLAEPVSLRIAHGHLEERGGVLRLGSSEEGRLLLLSLRTGPAAGRRPGRPGRDHDGEARLREAYRLAFTGGIELASYFNVPDLRLDDFVADPEGGFQATFLPEETGDVPGGDVDHDDGGSGGGGGTSCTAGGTGATSCSITCNHYGCSVSCGSGYYACCKCGTLSLPSCTCKSV